MALEGDDASNATVAAVTAAEHVPIADSRGAPVVEVAESGAQVQAQAKRPENLRKRGVRATAD